MNSFFTKLVSLTMNLHLVTCVVLLLIGSGAGIGRTGGQGWWGWWLRGRGSGDGKLGGDGKPLIIVDGIAGKNT